jgi:hypothetical protein
MRKLLVVFVAVIVALAIGIYWLAGDPNRFKPMIAERIEAETGMHVDLRGDLAWRLWPPVQLVANDVVLDWEADNPDPLAHIERLQLDADLWPLISRTPRLVVTGVVLDGLRANLIQEGESANWMPPDYEGPAAPPIPVPTPQERDETWMIQEVTLANSHVRYLSDGELTEIDIQRMRIGNIAPERRMPVSGTMRIVSAESEVLANVSGHARFDAAMQQYDFDGVRVHGTLLPLDMPYDTRFNARVDIPADSARIESGTLRLADADSTYHAVITQLTGERQIEARFDMPAQRPARLLRALEVEGVETLAVAGDMRMTAERLVLSNFTTRADETNASGTVTVHFSEPFALPHHFDFELEADRFVVPERETPQVAITAGAGLGGLLAAAVSASLDPADEPLLPLELIRSYTWDGTATIGELVYDDATFANARATTMHRNGVVNTELAIPAFFEGAARSVVEIDLRGEQPVWRIHPTLQNVDSQALLQWLGQGLQWAALLLAQGELTLTGNTERELFQSVRGRTEFDGGQGRLSIGELKQQAMAIASLAGTPERVQAWPDVLDYRRLTGTWQVDGLQHDITLLLDNVRLRINGTYDPFTEAMDMRLALTILDEPEFQSLEIHPRLFGVSLPVRCRGTLDAPRCRPDEQEVRSLLASALREEATGQARERLDEALERHIPDEYRAPARELRDALRGIDPRRSRERREE